MIALGNGSGRDEAKARGSARPALGIALVTFFALAGNGEASGKVFCSQTARLLLAACKAGVMDDGLVKKAICINVSNAKDRVQCLKELAQARKEDSHLCRDQHDTRL